MNVSNGYLPEKPSRQHPVHGILDVDGQATIVFDTVCTKDRKSWLANDEVHEVLNTIWRQADAWLMGRYVIMPDHIHFFAAATESEIDYENWVKYWKSQFTKQHRLPGHRWLTDHWDTRMRSEKQYEEKWQYVVNNSVRHGLVRCAADWRFKGEIYELRWG